MNKKQIEDLLAGAKGRTRPFTTSQWAFWREEVVLPENPEAANEATRSRALQTMPRADVDRQYPKTSEALKAKQAAFQSWIDDIPQYSPKALWAALETPTRYSQWQRTKQLPDLLTFKQYWFLAEFLRKTESNGEKIPRPDPSSYQHLANNQPQKPIKSKVGKAYGTWTLTGLYSESERVKPTFYNAVCNACGNTIQRFSYSRVGQPCGNCKRLGKALPIKSLTLPEGQPSKTAPINVWETPLGWIAQAERPELATRLIVIDELGKHLLAETLSTPVEKASEVLEETKPEPTSSFEKAFPTLDLPDI